MRRSLPYGRTLPVTVEDCIAFGAETISAPAWALFCYRWIKCQKPDEPDWDIRMTVALQNVINAAIRHSHFSPQLPPQPSPTGAQGQPDGPTVSVAVGLSQSTVAAIGHYLDDHRDESWDGLIERAVVEFLSNPFR